MPQVRGTAFSLIELLAVIAIIAILTAIALPTYAGFRNSASGAQTMSRMRTLANAYITYMGENNGQVPLRAVPSDSGSDLVGMWEIQTAIAPYLDLPVTGDRRFASTIWWDGFAERNGIRAQGNGEANLYYPDPRAWPGGPPRNRMTGWFFNYNAFSDFTDADGNIRKGFTRLAQISKPSKTAFLLSRRNDGASPWNTWSDGRKYSTTNPRSIGAKRFITFFDGHFEVQVITDANYNGGAHFDPFQ